MTTQKIKVFNHKNGTERILELEENKQQILEAIGTKLIGLVFEDGMITLHYRNNNNDFRTVYNGA